MPAPLRIVLSQTDDEMLAELRVATTVPQRTRDRAHMLRLNAQGWNSPSIAEMFDCHDSGWHRLFLRDRSPQQV